MHVPHHTHTPGFCNFELNRFEILNDASIEDSIMQVSERRFELVGKILLEELPKDLFDDPSINGDSIGAAIASMMAKSTQVSTSSTDATKGAKKGGWKAKVRTENLDGVRAKCFPNSWLMVDNLGAHGIARIVVDWDPSMLDVSLMYSSAQILCVQVRCLTYHKVFYASIVYGANSVID
ncbi:hypothetical protein RHSIM_Rhsim12G0125600 [Rhododendron simsii]|uniref:Uncharacterized protein n=1 Tax=Rhododendron simsii TaxID=118357 RepID=A0A834LA45_RHOSS|nr:hypothetical protein RHSIM_Rhsim12G0125600 [Rhododendron simsii]